MRTRHLVDARGVRRDDLCSFQRQTAKGPVKGQKRLPQGLQGRQGGRRLAGAHHLIGLGDEGLGLAHGFRHLRAGAHGPAAQGIAQHLDAADEDVVAQLERLGPQLLLRAGAAGPAFAQPQVLVISLIEEVGEVVAADEHRLGHEGALAPLNPGTHPHEHQDDAGQRHQPGRGLPARAGRVRRVQTISIVRSCHAHREKYWGFRNSGLSSKG